MRDDSERAPPGAAATGRNDCEWCAPGPPGGSAEAGKAATGGLEDSDFILLLVFKLAQRAKCVARIRYLGHCLEAGPVCKKKKGES